MAEPDGARRPGRPRMGGARSTVTAYVTAKQHDRLIQAASASDVSVSALVRHAIDQWSRTPGDPMRGWRPRSR